MLLKNQVAIITGATRGIGRAIALRFAEEGCNIAFCGRTRNENMIAVENEIAALGVNAKGYAVDVTQFQASQDFVKQVVDDFGHIDILVNNAGITSDNSLKRMTEEQWDSVINANLKSVFCMTKAVHPYLGKQGSGSIFLVADALSPR